MFSFRNSVVLVYILITMIDPGKAVVWQWRETLSQSHTGPEAISPLVCSFVTFFWQSWTIDQNEKLSKKKYNTFWKLFTTEQLELICFWKAVVVLTYILLLMKWDDAECPLREKLNSVIALKSYKDKSRFFFCITFTLKIRYGTKMIHSLSFEDLSKL